MVYYQVLIVPKARPPTKTKKRTISKAHARNATASTPIIAAPITGPTGATGAAGATGVIGRSHGNCLGDRGRLVRPQLSHVHRSQSHSSFTTCTTPSMCSSSSGASSASTSPSRRTPDPLAVELQHQVLSLTTCA